MKRGDLHRVYKCDELKSIPKKALTDYTETLSEEKIIQLKNALSVALELENGSQFK
jgi:mRNA-degrading endonuclease toxin of MazEF toxin-antitoxin module